MRKIPILVLFCLCSINNLLAQSESDVAIAPTSRRAVLVGQIKNSDPVIERLNELRRSQLEVGSVSQFLSERTYLSPDSFTAVVDAPVHGVTMGVVNFVKWGGDLIGTTVSEGAEAAARKFYDQNAAFVMTLPMTLQEYNWAMQHSDGLGNAVIVTHATGYVLAQVLLPGKALRLSKQLAGEAMVSLGRGASGEVVVQGVKLSSELESGLQKSSVAKETVGAVRIDVIDSPEGRIVLDDANTLFMDESGNFVGGNLPTRPPSSGGSAKPTGVDTFSGSYADFVARLGRSDEPLSGGVAKTTTRRPLKPTPSGGTRVNNLDSQVVEASAPKMTSTPATPSGAQNQLLTPPVVASIPRLPQDETLYLNSVPPELRGLISIDDWIASGRLSDPMALRNWLLNQQKAAAPRATLPLIHSADELLRLVQNRFKDGDIQFPRLRSDKDGFKLAIHLQKEDPSSDKVRLLVSLITPEHLAENAPSEPVVLEAGDIELEADEASWLLSRLGRSTRSKDETAENVPWSQFLSTELEVLFQKIDYTGYQTGSVRNNVHNGTYFRLHGKNLGEAGSVLIFITPIAESRLLRISMQYVQEMAQLKPGSSMERRPVVVQEVRTFNVHRDGVDVAELEAELHNAIPPRIREEEGYIGPVLGLTRFQSALQARPQGRFYPDANFYLFISLENLTLSDPNAAVASTLLEALGGRFHYDSTIPLDQRSFRQATTYLVTAPNGLRMSFFRQRVFAPDGSEVSQRYLVWNLKQNGTTSVSRTIFSSQSEALQELASRAGSTLEELQGSLAVDSELYYIKTPNGEIRISLPYFTKEGNKKIIVYHGKHRHTIRQTDITSLSAALPGSPPKTVRWDSASLHAWIVNSIAAGRILVSTDKKSDARAVSLLSDTALGTVSISHQYGTKYVLVGVESLLQKNASANLTALVGNLLALQERIGSGAILDFDATQAAPKNRLQVKIPVKLPESILQNPLKRRALEKFLITRLPEIQAFFSNEVAVARLSDRALQSLRVSLQRFGTYFVTITPEEDYLLPPDMLRDFGEEPIGLTDEELAQGYHADIREDDEEFSGPAAELGVSLNQETGKWEYKINPEKFFSTTDDEHTASDDETALPYKQPEEITFGGTIDPNDLPILLNWIDAVIHGAEDEFQAFDAEEQRYNPRRRPNGDGGINGQK